LHCHGLSDLFPHLYACRFASCLGCSRTLLRHRPAYGCDLYGLADQPRITARHARADWGYRLNDCGNHDRGRGAASTLVMRQGRTYAALVPCLDRVDLAAFVYGDHRTSTTFLKAASSRRSMMA